MPGAETSARTIRTEGMPEAGAVTVMQRKSGAGKPRPEDAVMSPQKALRQALAKTAQDQMQLPLSVIEASEARRSLAELPEAIEDQALMLIVEGPGGALGLILVSPVVLTALIEMQTMGRLGQAEVVPRRPTRTDAAMAAGFIDAVLAGAEAALAELPDITWAGGFRFSSWLEDSRLIGLLFEDAPYRMFRLKLDLGSNGGRQGSLILALPANGRGPGPRRRGGAAGATRAAASSAAEIEAADAVVWQAVLEQAVMATAVQVEAVHRVKMSIADVLQLRVGSVVPVPMEALENLVIIGQDGRGVANGRLGQVMGYRAVRLVLDTSARDETSGDVLGGFAAPPQSLGDGLSGASPFPAMGDGGGGFAMAPMAGGFAMAAALAGDWEDPPELAPLGALPPLGGFAAMGGLPPLGSSADADGDSGEMAPMKMAPMKIGSAF